MKATLQLECKNCIEDLFIDIDIIGNKLPTMSTIRAKAQGSGWSVGRDCYCPECLSKLTDKCSTCDYFEGNKTMGASYCRRYNSYVYFKPYNKVYPCGYTERSGTVTNICKEYFRGAHDFDADKLRKFILNNFEIHSDKTTIE